jgi:hypothetical protein
LATGITASDHEEVESTKEEAVADSFFETQNFLILTKTLFENASN